MAEHQPETTAILASTIILLPDSDTGPAATIPTTALTKMAWGDARIQKIYRGTIRIMKVLIARSL